MKIEITLEQYKNDEYPDTVNGKDLQEIVIRRHGIVILEYNDSSN